MPLLTTHIYLRSEGKYLMLHRTGKADDVNKGKWIGVGGKFEEGEAPEECLAREVLEETGFILRSARFQGVITFVYAEKPAEYIFTYVSEDFTAADPHSSDPVSMIVPVCDEGVFAWVSEEELRDLEMWAGDRIMLRLIREESTPFSLKLVYDSSDCLSEAWELSGIPLRLV